jgi:hypothetical protein
MLPDDPMRSGRTTTSTTSTTSTAAHAKIIPLRRAEGANAARSASARGPLSSRIASAGRRARGTREDAVRHYLKFMLPGIPVTAFVMTFLYGYLLIGMHTLVLNGHATEQSYTPAVDPTLPLIGALLVAFATGMLCVAIYWGYLRITERSDT